MIRVKEILDWMDGFAPFQTAMDYDNVGLLVGGEDQTVEKAVVALDITGDVVEEAHRAGAQLVISHHPVIFRPLRRLSADSVPYRLAKYGIAAICSHTNLDMAANGVNQMLADCLGLRHTAPLRVRSSVPYDKIVVFVPTAFARQVADAMSAAGGGTLGRYEGCSFACEGEGSFLPRPGATPFLGSVGARETVRESRVEMICPRADRQNVIDAMRSAHPYEEPAFDVFENHALHTVCAEALLGTLDGERQPGEFAALVKERLGLDQCGYVAGSRPVRKVALCSGAGGDYVEDAVRAGADAFVTGEAKHHELLYARENGITLVPAGHYATEVILVEGLALQLEQAFPTLSLIRSGADPDPLTYC